jgi:hypothetical protein
LFSVWFDYGIFANVLQNSKLGYEYAKIYYLSKDSRYTRGLLINMPHFIFTMVCHKTFAEHPQMEINGIYL